MSITPPSPRDFHLWQQTGIYGGMPIFDVSSFYSSLLLSNALTRWGANLIICIGSRLLDTSFLV